MSENLKNVALLFRILLEEYMKHQSIKEEETEFKSAYDDFIKEASKLDVDELHDLIELINTYSHKFINLYVDVNDVLDEKNKDYELLKEFFSSEISDLEMCLNTINIKVKFLMDIKNELIKFYFERQNDDILRMIGIEHDERLNKFYQTLENIILKGIMSDEASEYLEFVINDLSLDELNQLSGLYNNFVSLISKSTSLMSNDVVKGYLRAFGVLRELDYPVDAILDKNNLPVIEKADIMINERRKKLINLG